MKKPDQARIIAAKQGISSLVQALQIYKLDNYDYPSIQQGLEALVKKPNQSPKCHSAARAGASATEKAVCVSASSRASETLRSTDAACAAALAAVESRASGIESRVTGSPAAASPPRGAAPMALGGGAGGALGGSRYGSGG